MSDYSDAILALNPVGYWRLGESSGTNANDESSNNNDGTYSGLYLQGVTGPLVSDADTATRFAEPLQVATPTKVQVPRIAAYEMTSAFSLALWMRPDARPGGSSRAVVAYNTTDALVTPWAFVFNGNDDFPDAYSFVTGHSSSVEHRLWSFGDQDNPPTVQSGDGDEFPVDEWAFVVCTYDGTTKQMSKNGCLIAYVDTEEGAIDNYQSSDTLKMGMLWGHDGSWNWPGAADEIAVFDSVLTEAQIQELYTIGAGVVPTCGAPPVWGLAAGGPAWHLA